MTREEAYALVRHHVPNKNLQKHMLAAEAVMAALAGHFNQDKEAWALAGLLHDLDYDKTVKNFKQHGILTAEMLKDSVLPEGVIQAIKSHPGHFPRESLMDHALYAADPVTGLIAAAALMHPKKKLKALDMDFIMRRFREKRFAAGADRDQIASCDQLNLPLETFMEIALKAMQDIDKELGL